MHLDSLMAAAAERGLKVSLTLFNNWRDYGGMPMYLRWAEIRDDTLDGPRHHVFYAHPQIRTWARAFIRKLATRRNTVTGRLYTDDPTLFSWELVNEMEVDFDQVESMQAWVREMAGYLKELDPHHLVGASFSLYERRLVRDYIISTSSLPELDYVDVHFYPTAHHQRFLFAGAGSFEQVVDDLVQIGHQVVGKPLVIGEVGFPLGRRWQGRAREYWFERFFSHALAVGVDGVMVWSVRGPELARRIDPQLARSGARPGLQPDGRLRGAVQRRGAVPAWPVPISGRHWAILSGWRSQCRSWRRRPIYPSIRARPWNTPFR